MIRTAVALIGVAVLLSAGCSSVSTSFDYDSHEDFSKLKTFAWVPRENATSGNVQQLQLDNNLFEERLERAVNNNLQAKGYVLNSEDPDFVITYHTGVQDKVDITNWGYTYGPYRGSWGESIDVNQYTEGTLVLDFIDFDTKNIIWRGTAQKALSGGTTDPQKAQKRIQNVVDQLLAKFPPQ